MSPKLAVKMEFGSTVYGTRIPNSDMDYKGVILPTAESIIMQEAEQFNSNTQVKSDPNGKNKAGDVDFEVYTPKRFLHLLCQGQTVALDMLFTPREHYVETPHPLWEEILSHRQDFLHSGASAFVSFCKTQAAKYSTKGNKVNEVEAFVQILKKEAMEFGLQSKLMLSTILVPFVSSLENGKVVDLPNAKGEDVSHLEVCGRKVPVTASFKTALDIYSGVLAQYGERSRRAAAQDGSDVKALYHAVRVIEEAKELLLDHKITFPRPEVAMLMKIRRGEMNHDEVMAFLDSEILVVEEVQKKSSLPSTPNWELAKQLTAKIYQEILKNG